MENPIPKSKINKWFNVNLESYAIIYQLAVSRFEDILSESESITEKSIKMITGIILFTGFFTTILISDHLVDIRLHVSLIAWSGGLIFLVLALLVYLLFPKKIRNRGLAPMDAIINGLDNKEDVEFQTQLTYYNAISQLQSNIDRMIIANRTRHIFYTISLITSILILAYIPSMAMYIILSRS